MVLHVLMPKIARYDVKKGRFLQQNHFSQLWACVKKKKYSIKSHSVFWVLLRGVPLWENSQTCPYILIGETWDIIEKLKLNVLLKLCF